MVQVEVTCNSRLFYTAFSLGEVCFDDLDHLISVRKDEGVVFHNIPDFELSKHTYVPQAVMGAAPHPFLVLWESDHPIHPDEEHLPPNVRLRTNTLRYKAWLGARICFLNTVQPVYERIARHILLHNIKQIVFDRSKYFQTQTHTKPGEERTVFDIEDYIQPHVMPSVHICDFQCTCDALEPLQ